MGASQQSGMVAYDGITRAVAALRIAPGHLGVGIFFLVSGFIISHVAEKETRAEFVVKRVLRIWPTLTIAVFLMWLLKSLFGATPYGGFSTATSFGEHLRSAALLLVQAGSAARPCRDMDALHRDTVLRHGGVPH
jgi:peptidoglycan/LPS O-acetylase OafA/YrhL